MQAEEFDSSPTTGSNSITISGAITNAFDGDLGTNTNFVYGAAASGYVEVTGFKRPSDNGLVDFPITYVDIKVCYRAPALTTTDDRYRIVYMVDPSATVNILQDWVTYPAAIYPPASSATPAVRVFSQQSEPNGNGWTWNDLAGLRVRVEINLVGTNNNQRVYLYEVWATVYSTPFPQANTMSVQTPVVAALPVTSVFYVDVYVVGPVANMWGFTTIITFDPNIIYPSEYMVYGPFVLANPSEIGPDYVSVSYGTYNGDPTGFTGNTPIVRIWFDVLADVPSPPGYIPLTMTKAEAADVYGAVIPLTAVSGIYGTPPTPEFPIGLAPILLLAPLVPVAYIWRLRKKGLKP
jgi:hypothetical protein